MLASLQLSSLLCAVAASMVLGAVWYAPFALGKQWMDAARISEKQFRATNLGTLLLLQVALSTVMAIVLQLLLRPTTADTFIEGVRMALPLWVLITAVQATHTMYEGGRSKLIALNAAHEFFNILLMGGILAAWR